MTTRAGRSMAEQVLERVGEAVLQRLRQEFPNTETAEEPLYFELDEDFTSQPPTKELRFENTSNARQLFGCLPDAQKIEVFTALHTSARYTLNRAEPRNKRNERDGEVYVFNDQSAVELVTYRYRYEDPLYLPAVRALSWQLPMLLVGDQACPTEMNLNRLGYQEVLRTTDTTLYRHYDPTMPLVGYGSTDRHYHVTVFNEGQIPAVVTVSTSLPTGQLVDLRQPKGGLPGEATTRLPLTGELAEAGSRQLLADATRYPVALLDQVARQYAVELTGDNARRLLNGQKTDIITTGDGSTGKLYVLNTPDNGPQLVLQDVQRELTLKESYLGHVFSEKDKQNLHKYGDMGRAVELIDKQSGQKFTGFVGVDKDTKTLTVLRSDVIQPKIERMTHLKGVPLTGPQKQRLIEGKAVRLDNMTSKAGTSFSAYVRVSAASRSLRFDHIPGGQSETKAVANPAAVNASNAETPANPSKSERPTQASGANH